MNKLYIGNLSENAVASDLESVFQGRQDPGVGTLPGEDGLRVRGLSGRQLGPQGHRGAFRWAPGRACGVGLAAVHTPCCPHRAPAWAGAGAPAESGQGPGARTRGSGPFHSRGAYPAHGSPPPDLRAEGERAVRKPRFGLGEAGGTVRRRGPGWGGAGRGKLAPRAARAQARAPGSGMPGRQGRERTPDSRSFLTLCVCV